MNLDDKVFGVLGLRDNAQVLIEDSFRSLDEKIASIIDLKDNPVVQTAGMFSQQQPSAALPQLTENLTQLALQQVQEEMNKSTAVNDPMEAENERLRRQKENLQLQKEIQELQQEMQAGQAPQGAPPPGAPAGGMPGGQAGGMPPDMAAMYGAIPPEQQGAAPAAEGQQDPMEMLRQAAGG